MASSSNKKNKWFDKVRRNYRLIILNNDTFEEVSSYRITLLNFYILISSFLLLGAIIIFLLIFFTPLKQFVPGYGDVTNTGVYIDMYDRVTELEEALQAQTLYTNNFRKLLTGGDTGDLVEPAIDFDEMRRASNVIQISKVPEDSVPRSPTAVNNRIQNRRVGIQEPFVIENDLGIDQLYLIPPLNGEISASFQPQSKHFGLDIMAPKNTAIKAISDGIVIVSDWSLESGNTISILHKYNLVSIYKHNSVLLKKVGEKVNAGEAVAIIGNTGTLSSGPHLHFELWYDGKSIDPLEYLMF